ncbi:hypothetical protein [Rhodococcus sp. NPDC057529]|uniref:hypothetical protein n=1 Tax=Rhodococcus sp. NPDC057529 TaxID=3346158 RepID=UPI00366FF81E
MAANVPYWVGERVHQMPTILQHWDGMPTATLSKITGGARLLWIFHEDFPEQYGLFVHLTDYEAQRVYDTPSDSGLLEEVRAILRDRDAFVYRKDGDSFGSLPFRITKSGSEPRFAEYLWQAAEETPLTMDMGKYLSGRRNRAQTDVEALADARANTLDDATAAKI